MKIQLIATVLFAVMATGVVLFTVAAATCVIARNAIGAFRTIRGKNDTGVKVTVNGNDVILVEAPKYILISKTLMSSLENDGPKDHLRIRGARLEILGGDEEIIATYKIIQQLPTQTWIAQLN